MNETDGFSFGNWALPYCGAPPLPGTIWTRFNLDPVLIVALAILVGTHLYAAYRSGDRFWLAAAGWMTASVALLSPLCALSVSLFSARVAQHMLLLLVAMPLVASALPRWRAVEGPVALWGAAFAFLLALWFWHMPGPYEATFRSTQVYWAMHVTLAASGLALWATLFRQHTPQAVAAGLISSIQMGLLGAVIGLASWPMYPPHYLTSEAWGLTPLADQQLGGVLMWVPGCLLFLWVAVRSLGLLWRSLDRAPA